MKNIIIAVVFFVLCIAFILQLVMQTKQQNELQKMLSELKYSYEEKVKSADFALATLKEDMHLCFENEGIKFPSDMLVYDGNRQKNFPMQKELFEKNLVVRISQMHCQACMMAFMPLLQELKNERVVYLVDYTNKRYFGELKKNDTIASHRFFRIDSLPTSIEDLNVPYMFLLDKNMEMDCVFIPHKESPGQIQKYLDVVRTRIGVK